MRRERKTDKIIEGGCGSQLPVTVTKHLRRSVIKQRGLFWLSGFGPRPIGLVVLGLC